MDSLHKPEGEDKERLIKEIRERLDWYHFEASPEQFNENEVIALVSLLKVIDSNVSEQTPDVELSYAKFKQYMKDKRESEAKRAALEVNRSTEESGIASVSDKEAAPDGKKDRKISAFRSYRRIAVAAVLVVMLLVGGTVGAVNAEKRGGVFNWLFKDDEGAAVVIVPQGGVASATVQAQIYDNEEDIPKQYQEYLPNIDEIPSLDKYLFEKVEISKFNLYVEILYYVQSLELNDELILGSCIFQNAVIVQSGRFNDYEYMENITVQSQEMEVYSKTNDSDQIEYAIYFYMNEQQCYIYGSQSLDLLKQIALEYYDSLSE